DFRRTALALQPHHFGLRDGHLGVGPGAVEFGRGASVHTGLKDLLSFAAEPDGFANDDALAVKGADVEIILSHFSLHAQESVMEICRAGLGVGAGAFERAANAAPEIDLVAQVE